MSLRGSECSIYTCDPIGPSFRGTKWGCLIVGWMVSPYILGIRVTFKHLMKWVGWGEWEFRWKWNLDTFDQDLLGDQIVTLHDVCFSNREDEWCWRQENREAFVLRHIPLNSSTSVKVTLFS
jgi:hypothetical protein